MMGAVFRARVLRRALVLCMTAMLWAGIAQAQGLGSLIPGAGSTEPDSDISEIMRSAAENGVSVVVIDSEGRVLTEVGERADPAASPASDSNLMSLQDDAVRFRTALVDGFLDLPASFAEVLYILRASSPDGTIMAYVIALVTSLALFAVGMVAESQIYGKRIAKSYVVSRIRENPQGYAEKMPWLVFRFIAGVVGILFSMAVAYVLGFLIFGPLEDTAMQFTVSIINLGYFLVRFVSSLWRMILSPFMAQYRIPRFSDRDAKRLYYWLSCVAAFSFFTNLFGVWIEQLGLNYEVYVFLFSLLSLVVMALSI